MIERCHRASDLWAFKFFSFFFLFSFYHAVNGDRGRGYIRIRGLLEVIALAMLYIEKRGKNSK